MSKEAGEPTETTSPKSVSEARFRAAIDGSLDAFFVFTCVRDESGAIADFLFVDLNAKGAEVLGKPRAEILGQKLCELRPVNRTNGFFARYVRVFETQTILEEESIVPLPEGNKKWVHHQVVPLPDGVAITSRDVTRYRKLEAELRSALESAEQSSRALEEEQRRLEKEFFYHARTEAVLVRQRETISELAVPVVEAWEGVLALPVIGMIDEARAAQIMTRLLEEIGRTQARFVVLDLTGVSTVDTASIGYLLDVARAAALLGSRCVLSGIGGQVARAIVESDSFSGDLKTFARFRDALGYALRHRG